MRVQLVARRRREQRAGAPLERAEHVQPLARAHEQEPRAAGRAADDVREQIRRARVDRALVVRTARSTSSTTNTNCWPGDRVRRPRASMNATGSSPAVRLDAERRQARRRSSRPAASGPRTPARRCRGRAGAGSAPRGRSEVLPTPGSPNSRPGAEPVGGDHASRARRARSHARARHHARPRRTDRVLATATPFPDRSRPPRPTIHKDGTGAGAFARMLVRIGSRAARSPSVSRCAIGTCSVASRRRHGDARPGLAVRRDRRRRGLSQARCPRSRPCAARRDEVTLYRDRARGRATRRSSDRPTGVAPSIADASVVPARRRVAHGAASVASSHEAARRRSVRGRATTSARAPEPRSSAATQTAADSRRELELVVGAPHAGRYALSSATSPIASRGTPRTR